MIAIMSVLMRGLTMKIKPVNPVAKAVAISRRRTQVVPDKTKYNRNKAKEHTNAETKTNK